MGHMMEKSPFNNDTRPLRGNFTPAQTPFSHENARNLGFHFFNRRTNGAFASATNVTQKANMKAALRNVVMANGIWNLLSARTDNNHGVAKISHRQILNWLVHSVDGYMGNSISDIQLFVFKNIF